MKKKKLISKIGENAELAFEQSNESHHELKFMADFEVVAATNPSSIQEFCEKLILLQKNPKVISNEEKRANGIKK